jgi:proteasome accessory factor A
LASLDLEYHNIDPDRGLFYGLESEGKVFRLTTDADIQNAMTVGPPDTRGGIRGLCVRRFREQIQSIQWERVQFTGGFLPKTLDMSDLFEPAEVRELSAILENASSLADALKAWGRRKEQLQ